MFPDSWGEVRLAGGTACLICALEPNTNSEKPQARQVRAQFSQRGALFPAGASLLASL